MQCTEWHTHTQAGRSVANEPRVWLKRGARPASQSDWWGFRQESRLLSSFLRLIFRKQHVTTRCRYQSGRTLTWRWSSFFKYWVSQADSNGSWWWSLECYDSHRNRGNSLSSVQDKKWFTFLFACQKTFLKCLSQTKRSKLIVIFQKLTNFPLNFLPFSLPVQSQPWSPPTLTPLWPRRERRSGWAA